MGRSIFLCMEDLAISILRGILMIIRLMSLDVYKRQLIDWDYAGRMVDNWVNSIRDNLKIFLIIAGVAIVLFIVCLLYTSRCV